MTLKNFNEYLYERLQDPEFAVVYLQDALDESVEEFLIALRKYVQANGGVTQCAEKTQLAREAIYKMLSEQGNPELRSVYAILKSLGLTLTIARKEYASIVG